MECREEVSDPNDEAGENARTGGGVDDTSLESGSNGEQDGEAKGTLSLIGNVKARGVGETIVTSGASGASVVTSRSIHFARVRCVSKTAHYYAL